MYNYIQLYNEEQNTIAMEICGGNLSNSDRLFSSLIKLLDYIIDDVDNRDDYLHDAYILMLGVPKKYDMNRGDFDNYFIYQFRSIYPNLKVKYNNQIVDTAYLSNAYQFEFVDIDDVDILVNDIGADINEVKLSRRKILNNVTKHKDTFTECYINNESVAELARDIGASRQYVHNHLTYCWEEIKNALRFGRLSEQDLYNFAVILK